MLLGWESDAWAAWAGLDRMRMNGDHKFTKPNPGQMR